MRDLAQAEASVKQPIRWGRAVGGGRCTPRLSPPLSPARSPTPPLLRAPYHPAGPVCLGTTC